MMTDTKTGLKILADIIQKKIEVLNEVYSITTNQTTVIDTKTPDVDMFHEMIKEKKIRIDSINELDEKFQKIYDNLKKDLVRFKDSHIDSVTEIKKYIQENINIKIKIQLQEEKNKQILEKIYQ